MPSILSRPSRTAVVLTGLVVSSAALTAVGPAAYAAQLQVTTAADSAADGRCSLREALRAADTDRAVDACTAGAGADVVVVPRGLDLTVSQGPLEIASAVTVRGDGGTTGSPAVVRQDAATAGAHELPLLHVAAGAVVTLQSLTLADAGYSAVVNDGTLTATAVTLRDGQQGLDVVPLAGTALTNRGRATVSGSTVRGNESRVATVLNAAGATLTLTGSTFSGNVGTFGAEPAVANDGTLTATDTSVAGGGLRTTGTATLTRVTLTGAQRGLDNSGTARLLRSTVSGNRVGIANRGRLTVDYSAVRDNLGLRTVGDGAGGIDSTGDLRLLHSSVTGNSGRGSGGIRSAGTLSVSDTTIAGNTQVSATTVEVDDAGNPDGAGGVTVVAGNARLNGVTLARNAYRADLGSPAAARASGGLTQRGGTVTLTNTVLAANTSDQRAGSQDCAGTLASGGYDLVQSVTGCTFTRSTGDRTGLDARLGPLADNGGPTLTLLPAANSPLVDRGSPAVPGSTTAGACTTRDARGSTRPRDGNGNGTVVCDIGAVERRSATAG